MGKKEKERTGNSISDAHFVVRRLVLGIGFLIKEFLGKIETRRCSLAGCYDTKLKPRPFTMIHDTKA